jgi:hypothetical protein
MRGMRRERQTFSHMGWLSGGKMKALPGGRALQRQRGAAECRKIRHKTHLV